MNNLHERRALPEGWEWKRLGDVITFEYGKGLREDIRDQNGNIPVYGSNGIVGLHSIPLIEKPCIIVGRKGSAGQVHISKGPCWPIDTTYFITPPENIDLYFLFYLLSTLKLVNLDKSTAIPGLNRNDAYALKIPLPPLPTQRRIVSILEKADETKKLRAQADELTDRLLQSVFMEMFGDPVKNPRGWETATLGGVGEWTSGGTPSRTKPEYFQGTIPWYSAGELNDSYLLDSKEQITEEALKASSAKLFPKGTMLIGMYDSAAFKMGLLLRPASSNQACAAFIPKKEKLESLFALQLFKAMKPLFLSRRRGVRQKNLSQSIIKNFEIPLPPLPLQQEFARIVEKVEAMRQSQNQSKQQIEDLFSALMQKAFRGEI